MEKNNDLISVIEDLLEADMTDPKKVKNPQNKVGEEDKVEEAQDKTDPSIKKLPNHKPKADNQSDNSSEVVGKETGAAMDAGGDKDVGKMDKGKLPSDASDNSSEIIGSNSGAALDAGGDKDVGKPKNKDKGQPSDASPAAEPNKGPHKQSMGEDLDDTDETVEEGQDTKIVKNSNDEQLPDEEKDSMENMKEEEATEWDWDKISQLSEEEFEELMDTLTEDELAEFNAYYEALVEAQDDTDAEIVAEAEHKDDDDDEDDDDDDDDKDEADESVSEDEHGDKDDDDDDDDDDDEDHDKKKMKEASEKYDEELSEEDADHICESKYHVCAVVVEHPEWGEGKPLVGRHAEPDDEGNVAWYDVEFEHGIEEKVAIEGMTILDEMHHGKPKKKDKKTDEAAHDKGDMDGDGKDEPDSKEYMDNKDKAIKKAMAGEEQEVEDEDSIEEGQDTKVEKNSNEAMRPKDEKGSNAPMSKGGSPDQGAHDQASDSNETPTKANPKGPVKEDLDDITEDLEDDFKQKAAVIFETAVNEKANIIAEEMQAEYAQKLEEVVDQINEKVDQYVDYVVNEWLEENQLEIKYSLRTEIAENFIREMKGVFETNFIDIPEEEVSVVDELTEAVESYKEQIEEKDTALDAANRELLDIKRKEIVDEIGNDLPQTQKIRLEKLSENVEAEDIEEFRYKIEQLKEGYFDESSEQPLLSSLSEEVFGGAIIEEEDDSTVSQYAKFLSKTVTK